MSLFLRTFITSEIAVLLLFCILNVNFEVNHYKSFEFYILLISYDVYKLFRL
jgi:hypothetical protein